MIATESFWPDELISRLDFHLIFIAFIYLYDMEGFHFNVPMYFNVTCTKIQ